MSIVRIIAAAVLALLLAAAARPETLRPFEPQSLGDIVAAHHGRPFVVLVWSMDCEFCQRSLDTLSRVRATRHDFDIVTVSTDPLADRELAAQSTRRLDTLGLLHDAWSFGPQAPEQLRFAIDPRWRGEKPRSYWFDAAGRRTSHSVVITPELIDKLVR